MSVLFLDFETRSPVDITKAGHFAYAEHPYTDVMCTGFAFDDEPAAYTPWEQLDHRVAAHIRSGGIIAAHNAPFEKAIWEAKCERYCWPEIRPAQWLCTMAEAYALGLPGSLENASAAVGLDMQKDMAGNRLMRKLCVPAGENDCDFCNNTADDCPVCLGNRYVWHEDPEELRRLYEYCLQDIRVTQALYKRLIRLPEFEKRVWMLDQEINSRGVLVDLGAAKKAQELVEEDQERLNRELQVLTGGWVPTHNSNARFKEWLLEQGVKTESLAKDSVAGLLEGPGLKAPVRRALEIRQEAAKSSTAKLSAFSDRTCRDGRVRGTLQYHGAQTGRWAGRGVQLHNFPRPWMKQEAIEDVFAHLSLSDAASYIRTFHGSVSSVLSSCLRGFLIARPGCELIGADFSAIEARVLAWLAGQESMLGAFRDNRPVYEEQAAEIYGCKLEEVDKDKRLIGKVSDLALGYQGGVVAFQTMARNYGVRVTEAVASELWDRAPEDRRERCKWGWDQRGKKTGIPKYEWMGCELIKLGWRESNDQIVAYWRNVESAAVLAVEASGEPIDVAAPVPVAFRKMGSFLLCRLPSGRCLSYPYPQVRDVMTPWGENKKLLVHKGVESQSNRWVTKVAYGGRLVENITQGVARDLLAAAMVRVEEAGFPVVLHVHDEAVAEVEDFIDQKGERSIPKLTHWFKQHMEKLPEWAKGLPIKAEAWHGKRYRK